MRLFVLILCLASASIAMAGDVVETARSAKKTRRESKSKVITNSDVKKSKGTIVEREDVAGTAAAPEETLVERQQREKRDRSITDQRLSGARLTVERLRAELVLLEQSYYDETDLDRRDKVIAVRFADVSAKLAAAREALESAVAASGEAAATPGDAAPAESAREATTVRP